MYSKVISRHNDDLLVGHFGIKKIRELVIRKYFWSTLHQNVKAYLKGYNICLASKVVCHTLYKDL